MSYSAHPDSISGMTGNASFIGFILDEAEKVVNSIDLEHPAVVDADVSSAGSAHATSSEDLTSSDGRMLVPASLVVSKGKKIICKGDLPVKTSKSITKVYEPKKRSEKSRKGTRKKDSDKPKRPLSAYNLYFLYERSLLVKEQEEGPITAETVKQLKFRTTNDEKPKRSHRTSHGKITFANLAKSIATKWQNLGDTEKALFEERATEEKERYRVELEAWNKAKLTREPSTSLPFGKALHGNATHVPDEQESLKSEKVTEVSEGSHSRATAPDTAVSSHPQVTPSKDHSWMHGPFADPSARHSAYVSPYEKRSVLQVGLPMPRTGLSLPDNFEMRPFHDKCAEFGGSLARPMSLHGLVASYQQRKEQHVMQYQRVLRMHEDEMRRIAMEREQLELRRRALVSQQPYYPPMLRSAGHVEVGGRYATPDMGVRLALTPSRMYGMTPYTPSYMADAAQAWQRVNDVLPTPPRESAAVEPDNAGPSTQADDTACNEGGPAGYYFGDDDDELLACFDNNADEDAEASAMSLEFDPHAGMTSPAADDGLMA